MCGQGLFISLEGGEGAGKSTQAQLLAQRLTEQGYEICLTREPGGAPLAEKIRELLLFGGHSLDWRTEIMLLMTARCDHIAQKIAPALEEGKIVICDRFHDSTWAYQGYGVNSASSEILDFIEKQRSDLHFEPDLTFWLDMAVEIGEKRLIQRGGTYDRYEHKNRDFHKEVQRGFQEIYKKEEGRGRIHKINAALSVEEVHESLYHKVQEILDVRDADKEK